MVGMSKNEEKPAHFVPKYFIEHGYNIIPVNPTATEVFGRKSYPKVSDISEQVDIVDVFRRSEDVLPVIDDAISKKGQKTEVVDQVDFELPYGILGKLFEGYAYNQLRKIFDHRKIATIKNLETP